MLLRANYYTVGYTEVTDESYLNHNGSSAMKQPRMTFYGPPHDVASIIFIQNLRITTRQ